MPIVSYLPPGRISLYSSADGWLHIPVLIAAGWVWRFSLGWGVMQPVHQAAYPEGSDVVSVEILLELSPMMWDPCLVRW